MQDFIHIAKERGFVHQFTDEAALNDLLSKNQHIPCYIGFDATASSLHVGSLLPIMLLRLYQKCGHKPVILMGGGTTRVGDPSGKDETRQILTDEVIAQNINGIKQVFNRFLDFDESPHSAIMANNADWLTGLNYIDFLREFGRHFSINRMLQMDSVRMRLERESHLSFLEFNYMLLQSYDFYELHQRHNCRLQMGGSDQWGNIVMGIELARKINGSHLFGLTTPLLTTASGQKMGKTHQGAIWLNHDKITAYDYWQFWRNCEDADTGKFLRLFTELPIDEIARLEQLQGAELNAAKKILANEATSLNFGHDAALQAAQTAQDVFEKGQVGQDLPILTLQDDTIGALQALCDLGFCQSNSEARRAVMAGSIRLNDSVISDVKTLISADMCMGDGLKISLGKKKIGLIKRG